MKKAFTFNNRLIGIAVQGIVSSCIGAESNHVSLTLVSGPTEQEVTGSGPITPVVFEYDGDDAHVTVTGLPDSIVYEIDEDNKTITISGVIDQGNEGTITITVTDSTGNSVSATVTVIETSLHELGSIAISADSPFIGTTFTPTVTYATVTEGGVVPDSQKGVTWAITRGTEYATIDPNTGVVTVDPSTVGQIILITATSTYNPAIVTRKNVTVTYKDNLKSLTINTDPSYTGTTFTPTITYNAYEEGVVPDTQKGVTWSIYSGAEYATIDPNTGVVYILSNADNSKITIKATSKYNERISNISNVVTVTYPLGDQTTIRYSSSSPTKEYLMVYGSLTVVPHSSHTLYVLLPNTVSTLTTVASAVGNNGKLYDIRTSSTSLISEQQFDGQTCYLYSASLNTDTEDTYKTNSVRPVTLVDLCGIDRPGTLYMDYAMVSTTLDGLLSAIRRSNPPA